MSSQANTLDARLRALPGIEHAVFRAGQVVLYAGHYPPGLILVVSGSVQVEEPGSAGAGVELDADSGPFLFPGINELDFTAARTVRATSHVGMLIVPRSKWKSDANLRGLFQCPELVQVSLQAPVKGGSSE